MKYSIALIGFCLFSFAPSFGQTKYFVDKLGGSDLNDGLSWQHALKNLQTAISSINDNDTIWVAQGVYYTDEGNLIIDNNRAYSFNLHKGLQIFGGFVGDEISLAQRDLENNLSILSGDLMQNDGPNFANNADNAYHVVWCSNQTLDPLLDGFIITGGNADKPFTSHIAGGGMYNLNANPHIFNCTFLRNYAGETGGGMNNSNANVHVENCQFIENSSEASGGGMYTFMSTITLKECLFLSNTTKNFGGGMHNDESQNTLDKCEFLDNSADTDTITSSSSGGGVQNFLANSLMVNCSFRGNKSDFGGGVHFNNSNHVIYNGMFSGNKAFKNGGGIYNGQCNISLVNCSFAGNKAIFDGGAVHNHNSSPSIYNTVIWNNKDTSGTGTANASIKNFASVPIISSSLIQNITLGTSNNNLDGFTTSSDPNYPEFIVESDPDMAPFLDGNLRVHSSSTLIDTGDNSATFIDIDLDCLDRTNGIIDLGAYENPNVNCPQSIILDQNYSPLQGIYIAVSSITVTGEVSLNQASSVILNAMNVTLNPTLNVEQGADFTINNIGCTN